MSRAAQLWARCDTQTGPRCCQLTYECRSPRQLPSKLRRKMHTGLWCSDWRWECWFSEQNQLKVDTTTANFAAVAHDRTDFHDLYISTDEKLFNKISTWPNHILRAILPPPTAQNYSLRNRPHNRQLTDRISRITDCNFTLRMLYCNMYWLLYTYFSPVFCFILVYNCGLTVRNKRICYVML